MVTIAKERRPLFVPNESSKAVISSSVDISGSVVVTGGITGSIKNTVAGNPFIAAGANITTTYNSLGQWVITGTNSGSGSYSASSPVEVIDSDLAITTESIVNVTGLTQPRTITLPTPVSGTLVTVFNGDGSATSSTYVKIIASSGELIDGESFSHLAIVKPYDFTQYIYANNNWTVAATSTKRLEESWIDIVGGSTIEDNHDRTVGMEFMCLSDCVIQGFRLKINLPENTQREFDVKVWQNGSAIATKTITITGSTNQKFLFDTFVALAKAETYSLSYKDKSSVYCYYLYHNNIFYFSNAGKRIFPIVTKTIYSYSSGDSQPNNPVIREKVAPIEPIIVA